VQEKENRPLIAHIDESALSSFLQNKFLERTPFYQQAHYRLTGEGISESAIKKIIKNAS